MTRIMDAIMGVAGRTIMPKGPGVTPVEVVVATWDACLLALIDPATTPEGRLNKLAGLMWELVSSRVVTTAMTDEVKTITFAAVSRNDKFAGLVLIPENWIRLFAVDSWMQACAITHVSSKACDLWSGRLMAADVERRARAYESVLLGLAAKDESVTRKFEANDYQRKVIADFASGIPEGLLYTSCPFDVTRAKAEFVSYDGNEIQVPSGGRG